MSIGLKVGCCTYYVNPRGLTLPSRGQLPGYALQLPLMSNVRPHMGTDKRTCLAKAKALIQLADAESLRYAALELRMCMEYLTYQKLAAYENIVPAEVQAIWQPPQAVRALMDFEPNADKSVVIHYGVEDVPGIPAKTMQPLGAHAALSVRWLRKHYNKLGQLLHAPNSTSQSKPQTPPSVAYLTEVVQDLEAPVESTILGATFRTVWSVVCTQCGKPVAGNAETLKSGAPAVCFTPGCGTEYIAAEQPDGTIHFKPILVHFACAKCASDIAIQPNRLEPNATFECPACKSRHQITGQRWEYASAA